MRGYGVEIFVDDERTPGSGWWPTVAESGSVAPAVLDLCSHARWCSRRPFASDPDGNWSRSSSLPDPNEPAPHKPSVENIACGIAADALLRKGCHRPSSRRVLNRSCRGRIAGRTHRHQGFGSATHSRTRRHDYRARLARRRGRYRQRQRPRPQAGRMRPSVSKSDDDVTQG